MPILEDFKESSIKKFFDAVYRYGGALSLDQRVQCMSELVRISMAETLSRVIGFRRNDYSNWISWSNEDMGDALMARAKPAQSQSESFTDALKSVQLSTHSSCFTPAEHYSSR